MDAREVRGLSWKFPWARGGSETAMIGGLLGLVLLTGFLCAGPAREDAGVQAETGSLRVQGQYVTVGGAQPADGERRAPRVVGPAQSIDVMAVPSGDGTVDPVAVGTTDETGVVTMELPSGAYWVFVPATPEPTLRKGEQESTRLPDGAPVRGWTSAELSAGSSGEVTISIELVTP